MRTEEGRWLFRTTGTKKADPLLFLLSRHTYELIVRPKGFSHHPPSNWNKFMHWDETSTAALVLFSLFSCILICKY